MSHAVRSPSSPASGRTCRSTEVCRLASEWGYDGLELACWGDHFDVDRAVSERRLPQGRARDPRASTASQVWAISNHLVGQAVCDHPIDERHQGILPPRIWGDGEPEGVRQRAAAEMEDTARAAAALGVDTVVGFTGSSIWHTVAMFPPVPPSHDRARLRRLRRPLEPDPGRLRRGGRAVRARGAPERDRLRLLDDRARPGGDRPPARVRPELRPEPLRLAGPRPGRLPVGLPGPDLPRRLQGGGQAARTAATAGSARTCRGATRGAAGTSSRPATATCRGRRSSGCSTRSATTARSRSSGRTPGWTGRSARRRRWRSSGG